MTFNWQILQRFIERYNIASEQLVVALSGGADSVALLKLFVQLREESGQQFSAIHVNHGLSPNADSWQEKVSELCQTMEVELTTCRINIDRKSRTSLEQQAREGRYQAIAEQLNDNSVLFTGHHQIDQFETFLLRLMRSSGLTGLASMRPLARYPIALKSQKQLRVARPLLNEKKTDVIAFLEAQNVSWIEDESNQDDGFDRNFIRNNIIPQFIQRWSNAPQSVANSIEILQQESDLLEEYVHQDYLQCLCVGFLDTRVLSLDKLKTFSVNKQSVILRRFIHLNSDDFPSRNVIEQVLNNIAFASDDAQPELKVGNSWIRVHKHNLYLVTQTSTDNNVLDSISIHNGSQTVQLPTASVYSRLTLEHQLTEPLSIRWGISKDKLKPNHNSGSKKVKDLLKELGCPVWLRHKLPLIYEGETLIAVADFYIDIAYQGKVKITAF